MIGQKRFDEIKVRCEMATDDPWLPGYPEMRDPGLTYCTVAYVGLTEEEVLWPTAKVPEFDETRDKRDLQFIAHARQDIPDLLDEVLRLRSVKLTYIANTVTALDDVKVADSDHTAQELFDNAYWRAPEVRTQISEQKVAELARAYLALRKLHTW